MKRRKGYSPSILNNMKRILAIETTGKYASVALLEKDKGSVRLYFKKSDKEMNHLIDLMEIIDGVIREAGIRIEDVDLVSPSIGPGSFTGIRIGVSTARALQQACQIKGIPVGTLRVMAETDAGRRLRYSHYACTTINARRNQTYAALWRISEEGDIEEVLSQRQYMIDELLELIADIGDVKSKPLIFYGDGADTYADIIEEEMMRQKIQFETAPRDQRYQNASDLAFAALSLLEAGEKPVGYDETLPDYMRKTEAEMKLEQGEGKC